MGKKCFFQMLNYTPSLKKYNHFTLAKFIHILKLYSYKFLLFQVIPIHLLTPALNTIINFNNPTKYKLMSTTALGYMIISH
jgi:hypothetical protein